MNGLSEIAATITALECYFCGAEERSESWEDRDAWLRAREESGWGVASERDENSLRVFALCPDCRLLNKVTVDDERNDTCDETSG
jgi:hypothetical protein